MIALDRLAALPLFADADPGVLAALASRAVEVTYPADAVLFLAGSRPRGWYVVLEGGVRVVRGTGARQHVVHAETAGGTLGEVPLFAGETHPATAIATEPTRCALFAEPALAAAIAECPAVAFLLMRRLALRVRTLVARLDERSSKSVRARLAEFVRARAAVAKGPSVSMGMTQQRLAEELGTVREVVSRELRRLVREDVLAPVGGGRYRVRDAEALRRVAEG